MKAQESLNRASSPEIISTLTSLHPRSRILASFQKFQMSISIGKTGSWEIIRFSWSVFYPRSASQTAPAEDSRRTFSFGGGVLPYRQSRRTTRQMTLSGDSNVSYAARRTFSFGGAISISQGWPQRNVVFLFLLIETFYSKYSRRLPRQMTVSGDSGYSYSSRHYRSATKLFGRALSRTLTINSMDGSNSTILLEDWRFALHLL